jgi:protein O-mannosyl-transferase
VTAAAAAPGKSSPSKRVLGICVFLALGTLLVYWQITGHEFVSYDDTDYVTTNPHVQAGLSAGGWAWVWHSDVARNWHPLTMLSHMLDCQLYGLHAGWHHLNNLLLHIANSIILFLLLRKLTGALWRSGFVAALFALHPLHVESVAWVAERKDVLSTFFFLLTLGTYARYAVSRVTRHASRLTSPAFTYYLLSLLLFALGLMSKPMLVTLPFVLLLLDYWPLNRMRNDECRMQSSRSRITHHASSLNRQSPIARCQSRIGLLFEKLPFLILSAASCVITFRVQHAGGAVLDTANSPVAGRLANALMSYVRYLGKMLWPEGLAALYLRKVPWPWWEVALASLIIVVISTAAIRLVRSHPYVAVGWFWYLGTLVPVIGLVQVGMQTMADRYTYIPLIGVFIVVAWGGWELTSQLRVPRWGPGTAMGLALVACAVVTRLQVRSWKDSFTLYTRMVTAVEGNYMAHYNLGNLYSRADNLPEAVKQYEEALKVEPNYAEAHNNLGGVLLRLRRFDEAIAHHAAAARIRPEYLYYVNLGNALVDAGRPAEAVSSYQEALRLNPSSSQAHYNLALALQAQGKAEEAMAHFRAALQLQPDLESAEHQLANRLADAGRLEEAIAHYQAALRLDPNHAESYNGLGICYAIDGKLSEAERQFREAVRLKPDHAGAQSNLGNALGAQNKLEEAIPHYQKALEIDPKDYQTHFNLGVSLLRQGRSAEARTHFTEALRLHPDYPEAAKALASIPPDAGPQR